VIFVIAILVIVAIAWNASGRSRRR